MRGQDEMARSIAGIDAQLEKKSIRLRFERSLEQQYVSETEQARRRTFTIASFIAVIIYNSFLANDWQMIRDVFPAALVCRVAIFTPLSLLGIWIVRSGVALWIMESLGTFIAILAVALTLYLYDISASPFALTYHYGAFLILTFAVVVQRLSFSFSVIVTIAMMLEQVVGLLMSSHFNDRLFQSDCTFFATAGGLLLLAAYGLEHERRRSYLLALRGRFDNEMLEYLAHVDSLTGLFNRRYLSEIADLANTTHVQGGLKASVVLIDIDHFKSYNDSSGHLSGDECLKRIGGSIREAVAPYDGIAVRFGGEEFLVLLKDRAAVHAIRAARAIERAVRNERIPFPFFGPDAIVTCSIGVAMADVATRNVNDLVRGADQALYEAKRSGRNCTRVAAPANRGNGTNRDLAADCHG